MSSESDADMPPRVYLAVGHGSGDPGAVGHGWSEQSAGDVIVARMAARLTKAGATVKHEATQDDPNFRGSPKLANDWDADVFVAIHHDIRTAPTGSFAYHYSTSEQGRALATAIVATLAAAGRPTRPAWLGPGEGFAAGPVAPRDGLAVVSNTAMPATLVEVGPIGHATLDETAELRAVADLMADGVATYLGFTDPPPPPAKPDSDPTSDRFDDVFGPFGPAIDRVAAAGLMEGFADGTFRPAEPVTRGQLAAVLDRLSDR